MRFPARTLASFALFALFGCAKKVAFEGAGPESVVGSPPSSADAARATPPPSPHCRRFCADWLSRCKTPYEEPRACELDCGAAEQSVPAECGAALASSLDCSGAIEDCSTGNLPASCETPAKELASCLLRDRTSCVIAKAEVEGCTLSTSCGARTGQVQCDGENDGTGTSNCDCTHVGTGAPPTRRNAHVKGIGLVACVNAAPRCGLF
jgi:hypothetical protein